MNSPKLHLRYLTGSAEQRSTCNSVGLTAAGNNLWMCEDITSASAAPVKALGKSDRRSIRVKQDAVAHSRSGVFFILFCIVDDLCMNVKSEQQLV